MLKKPDHLRIVFADIQHDVVRALEERFQEIDPSVVAFEKGTVFDVPQRHGRCALVTPINSLGAMNGGLERQVHTVLGPGIEGRLQAMISSKYKGEMLVGEADVTAVDRDDFGAVVVAPTMRTPGKLSSDTVNPYLAMRAVLRLIEMRDERIAYLLRVRNKVGAFVIPGLGTGCGEVPPEIAAEQMRAAYGNVFLRQEPYRPMSKKRSRLGAWLSRATR